MGDFNAHIGTEDAQFTYNEKTNKNRKLLLDLAMEGNMFITNTRLQKKKGKLWWTYISDMTSHKTQVDYLLINKKWSNSVKDIAAYNTSIGSDHSTLMAKIKISLRTCKTPQRKAAHNGPYFEQTHIFH